MGNVPPSALRQPPPSHRLLIESTKRVRTQRLYLRRCKKANPSNSLIESLPDELLIEILLCLSTDDIYDNARLVCRRWFHLIHTDAFVQTHLHRTTSGLLLRPHIESSPLLVTATTQGQVETSKLSCRINFPIMCSCNGLALCLRQDEYRGIGGLTPFLFNPATKCAFNLPRFPVPVVGDLIYTIGMAYAAASMAYKVFASYDMSGLAQFVILTVGVDKTWRHVAVEGLSLGARFLITRLCAPLITGCFLHWVCRTLVVSFNVETETFTVTPTLALMFPQQSNSRYVHLSTGRYLSQFISCGDNWSWDVWEMKLETWEWRKVLPKINLEAHKCKIQQFSSQEDDVLEPVGWVRYPELLAFSFIGMGRYCIIYNLETGKFDSIEFSTARNYLTVVQHRNSLLWS